MNILNKKLTLDDFKNYIKGKDFSPNNPNKCVIHHTWKPTQSDWKGEPTILGMKKYYEGKGWTAGPHCYIAPDGIWLFTDMKYQGIHAGAGNYRSIGIEVVGNYDGAKWTGIIKEQALGVIDALMKELNLRNEDIKFHRDYSTKTCPGSAITKTWLFDKLEAMQEPKKKDADTVATAESVAQNEPETTKETEIVPEPKSEPKTQPEPISEPTNDMEQEKQELNAPKDWIDKLIELIIKFIKSWK